LLFYDEPSAGLDPVTSASIDQLILDLAKKAGVTSVVVTHEMDSAFVIADRMAMLDKGRMIMVAPREEFEIIRDWPQEQIEELDDQKQLIRQFLRGEADGPLTERKEASSYVEDLLGVSSPRLAHGPSVQSSKE
jgi:phospholipid/cholesterol/gamma-HCH transport system ATP-binding protein